VVTEDLRTGKFMARRIETRAVRIDSMTIHDGYPLPHGSLKSSGFDWFNAYQGLDESLDADTVTWMY
jgi:acyl-CoA reductase-like NAD-dependent aldehyde dehydrogenase